MLKRSFDIVVDDLSGIVLTKRKPSASRLLIYFSSADAKSIQGVSKVAPYDTEVIFIRDPRRGWYNLPIDGLSQDADELCEQIARRVRNYPRDRITMSGSSMGGYAALLFGTMLGVGRIVAIAPQIILRPELVHCPKSPAKYDDLTPLIAGKPKATQIDIWYGAESYLDLFNILRIEQTPTVRLHAVSGAMHNILATLKRRGQMEAYFKHIATGETFSCKTIDPSHAAQIVQAGASFYFDADEQKAIQLLEPIADEASMSAVYFMIGNAYFKLGDLPSARAYFDRSAATCPENYDANYYLGLVLDKMGKHQASADAYARSLEFFPSSNGVRLSKLASAQYRLGRVDDAITSHKRVLELDQRQTKSHFELGVMLMKKGEKAEALSHFHAHAKVNPNFGPTKKYIRMCEQSL